MFRTVPLSILRSLPLYRQQQVYVICHTRSADCLLAGAGSILMPLASSQPNLYDIYLLLCVQW